jgi:hypothetical protein
MAAPAGQFETPDPIVTTETLGAIVIGVITNLIVLFQLNIDDARQGAIVALVNAVIAAYVLYHGSRVRAGRAQGTASKT